MLFNGRYLHQGPLHDAFVAGYDGTEFGMSNPCIRRAALTSWLGALAKERQSSTLDAMLPPAARRRASI